MKVYDGPDIRNVALIGHGDSGKTSLASALLFVAGAVNRLGRVDDGTATTDFDDEEVARKISLQTSLAHAEWQNTKINLIDTPGYAAFVADAKAGLAVADAALLLVEAVAGVQVITERVFKYCQEFQVPRIFVINKLDRENASFERTMTAIQERFDRRAVPIQIPIGAESGFEGVIDLIAMKTWRYAKDASGTATVADVPADLVDEAKEHHAKLVEMVAESDDALMEAYFESGELPHETMVAGLHKAFLERKVFPVVLASATRAIGIRNILDAAVALLPSPAERGERAGTLPADGSPQTRAPRNDAPVSAFVFKTIADPFAGRLSLFRVMSGTLRGDTPIQNANRGVSERLGAVNILQGKQLVAVPELRAGDLGVVAKLKETRTSETLADPGHPIQYPPIAFPEPAISFAIEPRTKGDEDKISTALARLMEEDPVLRVARDPRTHELLVSGNGQVHVEVAIAKMKKKFGADAILRQPKVPYLETIKRKVPAVQGRHKKQTGGRGQFGDCWIRMMPVPRGTGYQFVDEIVGGSIPNKFIPAVDRGIQEASARGVLSGCPMVDFKVEVFDGSYHTVDSNEMSFKMAGIMAFKNVAPQCKPVLLEPLQDIEVLTPEEYLGAVMGDLSSRRGQILGSEPNGRITRLKAVVPEAEMYKYATQLQSITHGRATYHAKFKQYAEVPGDVAAKVTEEYLKNRKEELES